jgi:WD40-like Beta Propeller Repeat/Tetratricopeptide repeat
MVYSNKKGMLFVALAFVWISVTAQTQSKNDQLKFDADYYIMDKDYKKALGNYLTVLKSEPENADIKYRAAICYMNIEGERDKAIPLLEDAVQKVSAKYNTGSFKETKAPVDAWFLLGSAYRISNRLDDAINAYLQFKNNIDPGDEYNLRVTDQYIRQCERAKIMLERPVRMVTSNLGKPINTESANFNAVFSVDRKIVLYTSPGRQGYDIFYSTFGDTAWSTPKNITSVLATGKFMTTSDLSDDGKTLILTYDDPINCDLFISRFEKGRWSKVEPLSKEINTKSRETYGSLSSDGKVLYFTSDRKGGLGDIDIYKSELDSKGVWGKAVNMGPGINTPFNEASPFMSESGNRLYFSSEGHDGMGGYDIFYYDLDNPAGGAVNLGYPLNTTHNDLFYVPQGDGTSGYYAFSGEDTYGDRDIYSVTLLPEEVAQEPIPEPVAEESAEIPAVAPEIPAIIAEPIAEVPIPDPEPANEPVAETIPEPAAEEPALPEIAEEPTPVYQNTPAQNYETPDIVDVPVTNEIRSNAGSFRIQIMALKKPVDLSYFSNLSGVSVMYTSDSWYRVMVGITSSEAEAKNLLEETIQKGYKDAFIRPASVFPKYTIQIMAVPGPVVDLSRFSNLSEIIVTRGEDHFCRYSTGTFASRDEAVNYLSQVKAKGYPTAFVTTFK